MEIDRIKQVVIIGVGTMGVGIARKLAQAGIQVSLADINDGILAGAISLIAADLTLFMKNWMLNWKYSTV